MKISARNVVKGKVTELENGPVSSQIKVDLGVAVGTEIHMGIKDSEVMLATD
ncbi:MAG: hypothetical protein ACFCUW_14425 [Kiloniellaceae bacterium]